MNDKEQEKCIGISICGGPCDDSCPAYRDNRKHCLTCGTTHDLEKPCPPEAFGVLKCSCGNEFLVPMDAVGFMDNGSCGQCNKENEWSVANATLDDMKRLWKGYGES